MPFINSGIVSYPHCWKISLTPNFFIVQIQASGFTSFDVFLNLAQAREGTIRRQCLVILNDLTPFPIDCAREAANDPRSQINNKADGVKNEVGYVVNERPSNTVGFDPSLGFDKVSSSLWWGLDPTLWQGLS